MHNIAPSYVEVDVVRNCHNFNTRYRLQSVVVPKVRKIGKSALKYTAAKCWNSLSLEIQVIENKQCFNKKVNKFLFNKVQDQIKSRFVHYY